jgi:UDP-N-acetylglucosamine/UDP-N-acetylgalactosamine diphosphorylase
MTKNFKKSPQLPEKVIYLLKKGVRMTAPFSVEIDDDVKLERISNSLTIYGAARICGKNTFIADHVKLGYEAPVTVIDCQLGPEVELRGGYFAHSVFLNKAAMGGNAQIRSGCLLEEESGGNHCVGLKQTILFPFVQLGSLINFCDCLMAGGTSRKNHSEVGSSYIHFNYTPQQDKATASLIGDVSRGVMLREKPIFLGGQGGIVGPLRIDYGAVIPAGVICRHDCKPGETNRSRSSLLKDERFMPGIYGDITRKVRRNVEYIADLKALKQWYLHVRRIFFTNKNGSALHGAAIALIDEAVSERIKQMNLFAENLEKSITAGTKTMKKYPANLLRTQKRFLRQWPQIREDLSSGNGEKAGLRERDVFLKTMHLPASKGNSYLEAIQSLTAAQARKGTGWLQSITSEITTLCIKELHNTQQKEK